MNILEIALVTNCLSSVLGPSPLPSPYDEIENININIPEKYDLFHENQKAVIKRNNKKVNDKQKRFPTKPQYQNYCREK